jgi:poly-gamma-glutamate synthesis protein (capsule biosynthesis protein)
MAEETNGFIAKPASYEYIWGDSLKELDKLQVDYRIINLETSVTQSDDFWHGKGINYRMHPSNIPCLTAAKIDCCVLANNHVLDWGYPGLGETLNSLHSAGIATCGAGQSADEASRPAILQKDNCLRVLIFAYGSVCSGVPEQWAAASERPGVNYLPSLSDGSLRRIQADITKYRKNQQEIVIISLHWGDNWGYHITAEQQQFAHGLIDTGLVDIVFGHSSHHPRRWEQYGRSLIFYGCGDFINDYEGISGKEWFRPDLTLMFVVDCEMRAESEEKILKFKLIPMIRRRFQLIRGTDADLQWLVKRLEI